MTTAAEREVERAADAVLEQDRQRTEHERATDRAHEALIEESKRQHFIERGMCQ